MYALGGSFLPPGVGGEADRDLACVRGIARWTGHDTLSCCCRRRTARRRGPRRWCRQPRDGSPPWPCVPL